MASPVPIQERRRRKRQVEYALRLGEDERAVIALRASAAGVAMAHFIRQAALTEAQRAPVMSFHDADALIRELARVGVALNHLTRSMGPGKHVNTADLQTAIAELRAALKTVADLRTGR